jgi:hypothetical protein
MTFKIITITIFLIALSIPTAAHAFFWEKKDVPKNEISAATLETNTSFNESNPIKRDVTFKKERSFSFELSNVGSLDTVNHLMIVDMNNKDLASKILLIVELDGSKIYEGSLSNFRMNSYLSQGVGKSNRVSFRFSISEENYFNTQGESLKFSIKNYAGQVDLQYGHGFYDEQYIQVVLENLGLETKPEVDIEKEFKKEQIEVEVKKEIEEKQLEEEIKDEPKDEVKLEVETQPEINKEEKEHVVEEDKEDIEHKETEHENVDENNFYEGN